MKDIKIIFISSILILLLILYGFQTFEYINLVNAYNKLQEDYQKVLDQNRVLRSIVSSIPSNSSNNLTPIASGKFIKGRIVAVGVYGENMTGVLVDYTLYARPGSGNIFISINPHIGVDLQTSLQAARDAAQKYLDINLMDYDLYLVINATENVGMVDGPSAGLLLSLSIIALFKNISLNNFCITGAIDQDGGVHEVGGIIEKATACVEAGINKIILPYGQSKVTIYEKHERTIFPGFTVITIEPKEIDLKQYLAEKGYTVEVYEVKTLSDALKIIMGG